MKTNVSTLLREFPKIRRAALAGDEVIVVTREGNLRITSEKSDSKSILGAMKGMVSSSSEELDKTTTHISEWKAEL